MPLLPPVPTTARSRHPQPIAIRKARRRKRRNIIGRSDRKIGRERSLGCAFFASCWCHVARIAAEHYWLLTALPCNIEVEASLAERTAMPHDLPKAYEIGRAHV